MKKSSTAKSGVRDGAVGEPGIARRAGLVYVLDSAPGIRRKRAGKGFVYLSIDGRRISDRKLIARIRSIAVPPAYTNVWICSEPRGHLQATGRDARGRKQYRYHDEWTIARNECKFG